MLFCKVSAAEKRPPAKGKWRIQRDQLREAMKAGREVRSVAVFVRVLSHECSLCSAAIAEGRDLR
jgi:hypothetical protein